MRGREAYRAKAEKVAEVVDRDDYSFTVVDGFISLATQMFIYTGSLKAVDTYINSDGDYFEILTASGSGGGVSADYFWRYTIQNGVVSLEKADRCSEGAFACLAGNDTVEGFIQNRQGNTYVLAFGNKYKNQTDLAFVDKFVSTLRFK